MSYENYADRYTYRLHWSEQDFAYRVECDELPPTLLSRCRNFDAQRLLEQAKAKAGRYSARRAIRHMPPEPLHSQHEAASITAKSIAQARKQCLQNWLSDIGEPTQQNETAADATGSPAVGETYSTE